MTLTVVAPTDAQLLYIDSLCGAYVVQRAGEDYFERAYSLVYPPSNRRGNRGITA